MNPIRYIGDAIMGRSPIILVNNKQWDKGRSPEILKHHIGMGTSHIQIIKLLHCYISKLLHQSHFQIFKSSNHQINESPNSYINPIFKSSNQQKMSGLTPLDDVSGHICYDDGGANAPYDDFNILFL